MKKLAAVAAAALLAIGYATTMPASAAVTQNGSVNVKWNVSVNATLALFTNYTNVGAFTATANTIDVNANGGTGTCAGVSPAVTGVVDYGNITADVTHATYCGYENAVEAQVVTNSANWSLSEAEAVAPTGGFLICPIGNGAIAGFPAVAPAPATMTAANAFNAANQTAGFPAAINCTAATLGGLPGLTTTPAKVTTANFTAATPASGSYVGEGYVLAVPANAAAGAQTIAVNYQLIAN